MTACRQGHVTPEKYPALVPTAHLPHKRAWSSHSWLCLVGYALYTSCSAGMEQSSNDVKTMENPSRSQNRTPPPKRKSDIWYTVTSTLSCQKPQLHFPSFSSHMLQLLRCSWSHRASPLGIKGTGVIAHGQLIWYGKTMLSYHCALNCDYQNLIVSNLIVLKKFSMCPTFFSSNASKIAMACCQWPPATHDERTSLQKWTTTALTMHTRPRN